MDVWGVHPIDSSGRRQYDLRALSEPEHPGASDLTEQMIADIQSARACRLEGIGTLAGGIAHDLNNVLTPIMMSIELLKADSANDADRRAILDSIHASCCRGADLVQQVLRFARGPDGKRAKVLIRNLIDELSGTIGRSFPSNIEVIIRVPEDIWQLTGDAAQLRQVLLNLVINARDAMPDGGTLTITAGNVVLGARNPGIRRRSGSARQVLLQVSDTGTGITRNNYERIFDPFFTTKKMGEGTGLGLAIVHTIVRGHGGSVIVDSEIGHGTTFKVWLPAEPAVATSESLFQCRSKNPLGEGKLVLVVDDEFSIRDIALRNLKALGYRVVTASNGAEAVAEYAKQPQGVDLVLTDMMMPVMDGAATVREIRRINPSAKLIVMSGLDVGEELKSSVDGFLAKPYSASDLARMVSEVLDGSVAVT
jgi:signal transduction histidine kinase/ActR/RegA family two-component response regulator